MMIKKKIFWITTILLICVVYTLFVAAFIQLPYNISGTYGIVGEPNKNNIYLVLKDENFVVYNQEKVLEEGTYQPISTEKENNIYKLISDEQTVAGYIVSNRKQIVLLGFEELCVSLEKISGYSIYVGHEENQN